MSNKSTTQAGTGSSARWLRLSLSTLCAAILSGLVPGAFADTFREARQAYQRGDYRDALVLFDRAAWQGDTNAQWMLGLMYLRGRGTAPDPKNAASWFYKAAMAGHGGAQGSLAKLYYRGTGLEQDYREAALWFRRAADGGDLEARLALAAMVELGRGVEQDDNAARTLYEQSAAQGAPEAMYRLGVLHEFGRSVKRNAPTALAWYRKAASRGHADAYERLGWFRERGLAGQVADWQAAARLYRIAAESGSVWGQYRLGRMYRDGRGVAQNAARAMQWLGRSALRTDPGDHPPGAQAMFDRLLARQSASEQTMVRQYLQTWQASATQSPQ